jgi:hypothetical protein
MSRAGSVGQRSWWIVSAAAVGVAVASCRSATDEPAKPAAPDLTLVAPLPAKDLVGYLTGSYGTFSNNPALYADLDRRVFVMMGKRATAELALDRPDEAIAAFEKFLVLHGYAANGVQPTEDRAQILIDGKPMVLVDVAELVPRMPPELEAHFTQAQRDLLGRTAPGAGFALLARRYPVIWAYSEELEVLGGGGAAQEVPIAKAAEAFTAFRQRLAAK